jgi:Domain of unknown function (DUF4111)
VPDSLPTSATAKVIPTPVRVLVDAYLELADRQLPGMVEGLYLVGSVALGDWQAASDVDFIAVSGRRPAGPALDRLAAVHAELAARRAAERRAPEFDGLYVCWDDLARPPARAQPAPYHLDSRFVTGEDCFEANPATWQTLHDHGVAVRGRAPATLGVWTDPAVLAEWTLGNLNDYWARWIDESGQALARKAPGDTIDGDLAAWGVLGIARLHATLLTGQIVSKSGAGRHVLSTFPARWHGVAERCLAIRQRPAGTPAARLSPYDFADVLGLMRAILDDANARTR